MEAAGQGLEYVWGKFGRICPGGGGGGRGGANNGSQSPRTG